MKSGTLVKITKRAESRDPVCRAGNWNTFTAGVVNSTASLPVDYEIVGYLLEDVKVGKPVRLLRFVRNGALVLGFYQSTTVLELRNDGYVTRNSVYSVEIIQTNV
jgi:hypothetical protein